SDGVNRGVLEAHENGIVTSASLMVRYPAAAPAAEFAQAARALCVGLHFEAAEWRFRAGEWYPAYEVIDTDDPRQVAEELERQLATFERLMQCAPTHLDSHQHVHQNEPAQSILRAAAERLRVPLRGFSPLVRYEGGFYGQTDEGAPFPAGVSRDALGSMIEKLEPGWTEFGCHPGYKAALDSTYLLEREQELRVLCAPDVREQLARCGVQLRSFRDLRRD
ncbi:MAG: ChbG/HpnK family deacetylase, partial [Chthoniobacterales bacterium]